MIFSRQIVFLLLVAATECLIADFAKAAGYFSTVVIDPGHGGFDRGGIPGQLVAEKMVALDTALRLQTILERAGLRTVMTRTTDIFVPLPTRAAIANAQRDAIFVSIHYNASPRSRAHGIETYCEDSAGAPLAARIQRDILIQVSAENRGVKRAEYYVLRNCQIPAVLVECGFLTNPIEARLALTPSYRQHVAEQIAAGIIEQRSHPLPAPSPPPPRKKTRHHRYQLTSR
jgi:N-acetylmuramoyl-L-alanine amidase